MDNMMKDYWKTEKYIKFMISKTNGFNKTNDGNFIELEDKWDDCPICLENIILKKGFFDCNHSICADCFIQLKIKKCCLCRSS
jgi:hypothetical protein